VAAGAALCRQRSLFTADTAAVCETAESQAVAVGMLLDRLVGRLGRAAVFAPRPVADPQPEHAWVAVSPTQPATAAGGAVARPGSMPAAGRRPIWMPPRPVPLEPVRRAALPAVAETAAPRGVDAAGRPAAGTGVGPAVRPVDDAALPPPRLWLHGRWHRVAHAHGPERIETAWWRGPSVRRDYYVVETECGERFWVFRCRRAGRWFLHGMFA
jgi:protein ImuB